MALQAIHDNVDDIPEQYRDLYSERDGKWELTGVTGVKTQADIDRLQNSLVKERNDHKITKEALGVWGDLKHEDVVKQLDRIPELEAAANGGIDETKMNELVEGRIKTRLAPIERENATLKQTVEEQTGTITQYETAERTRKIHDAVREFALPASGAKMLDTAIDDANMLAERIFEIREDDGAIVTRDNVGVTPGIGVDAWLVEMQEKKPHWWPTSGGGGSRGAGGGGQGGLTNNPWSKESWSLTEQGKAMRENPTRAEQMMKAANAKVGQIAPTEK